MWSFLCWTGRVWIHEECPHHISSLSFFRFLPLSLSMRIDEDWKDNLLGEVEPLSTIRCGDIPAHRTPIYIC